MLKHTAGRRTIAMLKAISLFIVNSPYLCDFSGCCKSFRNHWASSIFQSYWWNSTHVNAYLQFGMNSVNERTIKPVVFNLCCNIQLRKNWGTGTLIVNLILFVGDSKRKPLMSQQDILQTKSYQLILKIILGYHHYIWFAIHLHV